MLLNQACSHTDLLLVSAASDIAGKLALEHGDMVHEGIFGSLSENQLPLIGTIHADVPLLDRTVVETCSLLLQSVRATQVAVRR